MKNINILDCTLRDGGYVNNFEFGFHTIKEIISKLGKGNIDIIECGFLRSKEDDINKSLFHSIEALTKVIGIKNVNSKYVAMIAYGEISANEISDRRNETIDGIRITFHENQIEEAFAFGQVIMEKGYDVFMQPVGLLAYTDELILQIIRKVNQMKPFAFYIVDTLGNMYEKDLLRLFYLIDNNLSADVRMGFHSHNNLQLSFSNAQALLNMNSKREIIIDSSVFGMGRGAGNLCTELITQYINENIERKYNIESILEIVDEHISNIMLKYKWGYSIPYYIAAVNNCHPDYVSYLTNKQTLLVQDIDNILSLLDNNARNRFDKDYIENKYYEYMGLGIDDTMSKELIKNLIKGREILILAPGANILKEKDKVVQYINRENPFIISVNFLPRDFQVDMVFVSNMKRFKTENILRQAKAENVTVICTSNINATEGITVNYSSYLKGDSLIRDNAGLILMHLLISLGVDAINLAGFDGFKANQIDNYYDSALALLIDEEELLAKSHAFSSQITELRKNTDIYFITTSYYDM